SIPPWITRLTNISWDMVRNAQTFAEVCDQLLGVLDGRVFVAHNANFDWRFLTMEIDRAMGRTLSGRRLCTVKLARKVIPGLGRWTIHAIQAGGQKLDGGAMFGVVPKPLWERRIVPDEKNRIQLGMRCLLVDHEIGPVLIDTGAGNKENEKFYNIYGIENRGV